METKHPADNIVVRDLAGEPLPVLDGEIIAALGGNGELNERQKPQQNFL